MFDYLYAPWKSAEAGSLTPCRFERGIMGEVVARVGDSRIRNWRKEWESN